MTLGSGPQSQLSSQEATHGLLARVADLGLANGVYLLVYICSYISAFSRFFLYVVIALWSPPHRDGAPVSEGRKPVRGSCSPVSETLLDP